MPRVSEGFLFGESHLREVFTHLLNRLAVAGSERSCPRSPRRPARAALQNIHLKPSCKATAIALAIPETSRNASDTETAGSQSLRTPINRLPGWTQMQIMQGVVCCHWPHKGSFEGRSRSFLSFL